MKTIAVFAFALCVSSGHTVAAQFAAVLEEQRIIDREEQQRREEQLIAATPPAPPRTAVRLVRSPKQRAVPKSQVPILYVPRQRPAGWIL